MRALITGITGFAGSHLAEYLLAEHPTSRSSAPTAGAAAWTTSSTCARSVQLLEADLRDYTSMHHALEQLAAGRHLPSRGAELRAVELDGARTRRIITNVAGQTNLFEAVRALELDPVVQIACSSEQYGLVLPDETPIKETNPLRPLSPYAVSKVAQDYPRLPVLPELRPEGDPHPRLQPHRAAARAGVRHLQLLQPGGGDRARAPGAGDPGGQHRGRSATSPTCATWCAPTGWRSTKAKPGEVYNIATGNGISHPRACSTACSRSPTSRSGSRSIPSACAPPTSRS